MHIHATYRAGLIHPHEPLDLPDNTQLELTVTPTVEGPPPEQPLAAKISVEELNARLNQFAVSVGALSSEFSRADIYFDHD